MTHHPLRRFCVLAILLWMLILSCNDPNRIAVIDHRFSGCFGDSLDKLSVYKQNGKIVAILQTNGEEPRETTLTSSQLNNVEIFIDQLKDLKERDGCTTVESYFVVIRNKIIKKQDGSCSWDGFSQLVESLFEDSK